MAGVAAKSATWPRTMGRTAAAALRAAVLCTWLVVTSGQMPAGEAAAEAVVEELLKKPRLKRLGRERLHELLRDYSDYYYSDYSAMDEKLTELVTRVAKGVMESESEEATTMRRAPARCAATEPCTCDKVEIRGSAEVKQLQPASLGGALRDGPERWPVKASCIRSQDEIRDAAEPDDDELTNADVGALGLVIALLIGVLVIVAHSCALPVMGAAFASASTHVRARYEACVRALRELTLPEAVRAARRRQEKAAPDSRAARREEAARQKADARRQQEAARQQAEADRRQKDAAAAVAAARRAEKAAAKREEAVRAQAAAAARRSAQESAAEHLYDSLEQEALCTVVREMACEAVREVKLEHAAGTVFEAMLLEVATATARSLAPTALVEAAELAKRRAEAAAAAHAEQISMAL